MALLLSLFLGVSVALADPASLADPAASSISRKTVYVTAEPSDVVRLYREAAMGAGLSGAALLPACQKWSEYFFMCFMVQEENSRRMIHLGDLGAWGASLGDLEERARETGRAILEDGRVRRVEIEGVSAPYWAFDRGDGVDASALLFPEELAAQLGGELVFAVPSRGLVIAWPPGDSELDQVVAVGVRRIHEDSEQPISPVIVRWSGWGWTRWGQAMERR